MAALWIEFLGAKTDEDRFQIIYNSLLQSNDLPLSKSIKNRIVKDKAKSTNSRVNGNAIFTSNVHIALTLYNKSICTAPYPASETDDSTELALAFANRSAVYEKLNNCDAALRDIEQAFKFKYPKDLSYKLFERKGKCFTKMGRLTDAAKCFQEALALLPLANKAPADKMKNLTSSLEKLNIDSNKDKPQMPDDLTSRAVSKKTHGQHSEIPAASNCLEIKHSLEYGRHIVSTKDINPGDILAIEEPYCSVVKPGRYDSHCFHCIKRSDAMIPCTQCNLAMFCSEICRSSSWQEYHRIECLVLADVKAMSMQNGIKFLALRSLIIACYSDGGKGLEGLFETTKYLDEKIHVDESRKGFDESGQYNSSDYEALHYLTIHPENKSLLQLSMLTNAAISIVNFLDVRTDLIPKVPWKGRKGLNWNVFAGGLLIRFMRIAHYNSLRIDECFNTKQISKVGIQKATVADGIYSFHSLFNHACWPNASRYFCDGDTQVLFAILPIKKGEQIYITYAADYKTMTKKARKSDCVQEWFFTCRCVACTDDWPLYQQLSLGVDNPKLICSKCNKELVPERHNVDIMVCEKCKEKHSITRREHQLTVIFKKMQQISCEICSIKKPSEDINSQAATLLGQILKLIAMPYMAIIDCQELVSKSLYRTMGNYYVSDQ